jgi:transcriptional regulator with XRE-family HTH domain
MSRTTLAEFKEKALSDPDVKKEYESLAPTYALRKQLIAIRKKSGLTQEQIAERMRTKKSNISRLESPRTNSSPKLSTIEDYARAAGYKMEIRFIQESTMGFVPSDPVD